ncbi:unnamed protein product [Urochloa humidicola]
MLQIQEPPEFPEQQFSELDEMEVEVLQREKPLKTFKYDVLIHLDRVLDYDPDEFCPGRQSFDSDISGIPCDEPLSPECPAKFDYTWHLGFSDGERPARRPSVYDRLGGRSGCPDHSPPRGGSGGGLGLHQRPPASAFDMARWPGGRREDRAGSSGGFGGGRRRGDTASSEGGPGDLNGQSAGAHSAAKVAASSGKEGGDGQAGGGSATGAKMGRIDEVQEKPLQELGGCGVDTEASRSSRDPMLFEAALPQKEVWSQDPLEPGEQRTRDEEGSNGRVHVKGGGSAQQERSVEPTPATAEPTIHVELSRDSSREDQLCQGGQAAMGSAMEAREDALFESEVAAGSLEVLPVTPPDEGAKENRIGDVAQASENNGPPFDLNVGLGPLDEEATEVNPSLDNGQCRNVLKQADARMNRDGPGTRAPGRGITCLSITLRKSLLCAPPMKTKQGNGKRGQADMGHKARGGDTRGSSVAQQLSTDDEAVTILLKASGVLGEGEMPSDQAKQRFGESLACPMQEQVVGEMRNSLGLPDDGGVDRFGPLIQETEVSNDA